jgi:flagellar motor switch protein FliM
MTSNSDDDAFDSDGPPVVSDEEVEALLDKAKSGPVRGTSPLPGVAEPYDLVARDKIVRGRMPALDRINERWVGEFERELTERVRRPLEVSLKDVQLAQYGDWQASLPFPSSLNVYTVKPWPRNALIAVDGKLLFVLVDSYYGGAGRALDAASRTDLTPTEHRLNRIIADLLARDFQQAFASVAKLEPELVSVETNPNYISIATPSEVVVVTRVDVSLNGAGGAVSLIMPLQCFDAVRDNLAEGFKAVSEQSRRRWQQALGTQLQHSELELASVFLEMQLSMRELLQLKPGDVLPIEMPKTAVLYAGRRPLLRGKFGLSRGYNAVSVVEAVRSDWPDAEVTSDER